MRNRGAIAFILLLFWTQGVSSNETGTVLNVRDFGASGDGMEHSIKEWARLGRYDLLADVKKKLPSFGPGWSVDEAAYELAKQALPPEGGTIYFPAGTYIATGRAWTVGRDNITIRGDGPGQTILMTGPKLLDGLVLAGYRHVGWSRGYPFDPAQGGEGTDVLHLRESDAAARFRPGQLVFVRNGANRFDQDYGEMNEVKGTTPAGGIQLVHPLARDYTWSQVNWAGKTAASFRMPAAGRMVRVELAEGPGFFVPDRGGIVSVGENVFRVHSVQQPTFVQLVNLGRGNAAVGSVVPAGTLVAKERGLVSLDATTRNFRCESLTVRGRRKALTLSNSYDSAFSDCIFERVPGEANVSGGIVIDGDDGRFARFTRCEIRADPASGMQFARSFGNVEFNNCRFLNTNAAFTEFNFDCAVTKCSFDVSGSTELQSVIIVGKSCNDLKVVGNTIAARNLTAVFDAKTDIQSFKIRGKSGAIVIQDNTISAEHVKRVFDLDPTASNTVDRNAVRVIEGSQSEAKPTAPR